MQIDAWLNRDSQFIPGEEIFRSGRHFTVWAYTVSHSQLLLRARATDGQSHIDVLFKPVEAMKLRTEYEGLIVRCGTAAERDGVLASTGLDGKAFKYLWSKRRWGSTTLSPALSAGAKMAETMKPSSLAFFPPGGDPNRILAPDDQESGDS